MECHGNIVMCRSDTTGIIVCCCLPLAFLHIGGIDPSLFLYPVCRMLKDGLWVWCMLLLATVLLLGIPLILLALCFHLSLLLCPPWLPLTCVCATFKRQWHKTQDNNIMATTLRQTSTFIFQVRPLDLTGLVYIYGWHLGAQSQQYHVNSVWLCYSLFDLCDCLNPNNVLCERFPSLKTTRRSFLSLWGLPYLSKDKLIVAQIESLVERPEEYLIPNHLIWQIVRKHFFD